jgi:hypothetical protein
MLGCGHFYVWQRFEVSPAQNNLFPGIRLNGQLLTLEGGASEDQREQQSPNSNAESKKILSMSHPKNHDFCCLDEGGRSLTSFETHFPC